MSLSTPGHESQNSSFRDINITPMVDVMLVLLIVFMVTAPLLVTGLRVDLPEVQATNTPIKDASLIVSVTRDERILLGEQDVTAILEHALRINPAVQKGHELYIRADKMAHYGVVARAVAAARSAGVTSLNLLVDPSPRRHPIDRGRLSPERDRRCRGRRCRRQLVLFLVFSSSSASPARANLSDENSRPIAVAITPVSSLSSDPHHQGRAPGSWQRHAHDPALARNAALLPKHIERAEQEPHDAVPLPPLEPQAAARPPEGSPTGEEESPASAATAPGEGAGEDDGFDELKQRAIGLYRGELVAWFLARFDIRGKLPFETLKGLHGRSNHLGLTRAHGGRLQVECGERQPNLRCAGPGNPGDHSARAVPRCPRRRLCTRSYSGNPCQSVSSAR